MKYNSWLYTTWLCKLHLYNRRGRRTTKQEICVYLSVNDSHVESTTFESKKAFRTTQTVELNGIFVGKNST